MRRISLIFLPLLVLAVVMGACDSELSSAGQSVQPASDGIRVEADTFMLVSGNYYADNIYTRADSFLIGRYVDAVYGTTEADLLTQLACPEGYTYPEGAEADSAEIYIYYSSYFGYANTAMRVRAYEMDRSTFGYSDHYASDLLVGDYCSLEDSTFIGEQVISLLHPLDSVTTGSGYTYYIKLRTSAEWARRFFDGSKTHMETQAEFNNFFKGIYVTTDFGTSAMLNVSQVDLALHYHFTYTRTDGVSVTTTDTRVFPANQEVRQINLFRHPDRSEVQARLDVVDSVNHLVSPAGIFTRIEVPMERISSVITGRLGTGDLFVNSAKLRVEVVDYDEDGKYQPASTLLLVREDTLDAFFRQHLVLSDTYAIVASITAQYADDNSTIAGYYYSFDLSEMIEHSVESGQTDNVRLILLPVNISSTSTTTTSITNVQHSHQMTGVKIRSASNSYQPMKMSVVYSRF